ncbi:DNA-directed DNA polymerase II small subunit [Candidatus Woesearchaeota archaeon]|jgi:DNA polymerase II small subunit|nr:DNA-directed DNA polymerase II small subunit [Candidatus Woesearchaeota archaeon]
MTNADELVKKKEIVKLLLARGIMVNKDVMDKINNLDNYDQFLTDFEKNLYQLHLSEIDLVNSHKLSKSASESDNKSNSSSNTNNSSSSTNVTKSSSEKPAYDKTPLVSEGMVKIISSYNNPPKKREVKDFVSYFSERYKTLRKILLNRKELMGATSINKLKLKQERDKVAIIGLITDKKETKNGNIIFELEDLTGRFKVLISKNKSEQLIAAKDCVLDECVGVEGNLGNNIIFANSLIFPDIPIYKEVKKSPEESYAIFIGDLHFGSKYFLHEAFDKFLNWMRVEHGSENQREIARKVKYLFIVGDVVEGVGIYPGQDNDLEITDIYEQYSEFSRQIAKIPKHIKIIIIPGNHDAMRIAEPQPPIYQDYAEALYELENAVIVSSPSIVNIDSTPDFVGFNVLMYHGFSFIYYADAIERIRSLGGQERVDLIMEFLLKRRHLAPTHKSTLYLPDVDKDYLVIESVPDFFISGHIHRVSASNYRGVTMLNCSCWLATTDYQEKLGLKPQPGRVTIVNLQTRKAKILKFSGDEHL